MKPTPTPELLPCPFCGGTNLKTGGDDKVVGVWCLTCQAAGPNHYGSREWDDRALSVPAAAVVGEPVGDVAYNAGLEIRYAIAEVDAIIERRLAEARKAAFIEAAEIAEKLFTAEFTPQEPGFMRGIGYAAQTIFDDLRAKAEDTHR